MIIEKPSTAPANPAMQDIHPNISLLKGKKLFMLQKLEINKLIRYKYTDYIP